MNQETRQCQNCKQDFVIESEDFDFYEKMKVPAPTFCPDCRIIRRMSWRNERTLYHRKCDLPAGAEGATGKNIITMFAPDQPLVVYERDYWWSDKWDQLASGRDYDFSKSFFQQFRELFEKAPLPNLANSNVVNSEYGNHSLDMKNCYLHYASLRCEDSSYIAGAIDVKNSLDLYKSLNFTQCYDDVLGNCVGDNILNSKNVYMGFDLFGTCEDCKYVIHTADLKDSYDGGPGVGLNTNNTYEAVDTGDNGARIMFSVFTHSCQNTNYTYACQNSKDLFGCVGLRSKQYCILNKQYTKEEYEELVPKIIEQMNSMPYVDKKGRAYKYGEFFPTELSPFTYNETIAQEYYSKTKSEILELGYNWREPDTKKYTITIKPEDLPDHIKDVSDDILNQVIGCEHVGKCNEQCTGAFKIIPSELQFYRAMNLALPRLCSNCRHYQRLAQRTPFKLWDRNCAKCGKDIKTSYSPDREEIIYCEACYNQEVA